jgi:hypothetical protein
LVVAFADGTRETVQWDDSARWKRFQWIKPARALSAQLDPDGRNSLDRDRLDTGMLREPDPRGSRRLGADTTNVVQLAIGLLSTL